MTHPIDRRSFLAAATLLAAAPLTRADAPRKPKLKKAVKYDMIKIKGSAKDKLELVKSLGFLGVEVNSPSDINRDELLKASQDTTIKVHGVIDSIHWSTRLSDPKEEVRAKGLAALQGALEDAKFYGADSVLLVPGKVANAETENFEQVWQRSRSEVQKAIPLAERLGVRIAIEVVWNNFIETPFDLIRYVDQFNTSAVGAYFDCSNMVKFGVKSGDWIRQLGVKRLVKFDFKGYSKTKGWVPIGEGDEDWPDVVKALGEIGYEGWATAEVAGGGEKELKDVADRMNRILEL